MRTTPSLEQLTPSVDIAARPQSKIEWWFVHGRYEGRAADERYFMVSLFRIALPERSGQPENGYSALISCLDPRTGRQATSSRVDRATLDLVGRPADMHDLDPFSHDVVLDEIRRYGLPREFVCPATAPSLSAEPLEFIWADIRLAEDRDIIELAFDDPGTGEPVRLTLSPVVPPMDLETAREFGEPEEAMEYASYPRLALTGSAGATPVRGEAWLDHQWGGMAWLRSSGEKPRQRGWDWLGFNLDDGSTWIAGLHWDARSRMEISRGLTYRSPSGRTRVIYSFEWTPTRWWSSCATRIRHPVAWRLQVPELEADLTFEPLADDQEIRVFTPQRAIWEGAGRVSGTIGGRQVSGIGRLEGQGRGYVFACADYLKSWADLVDETMMTLIPRTITQDHLAFYTGLSEVVGDTAAHTEMLSRPLWDLMDRNGKRWRAVCGYLLLDALGRDPRPLTDVIFTFPELLHNASLIIDDIQDGSTIRRGADAIHRRYGLDVAISAANTAYFLPLMKVIEHPVLTGREKTAIYEAYNRQLVRAHLGQSLDIYWANAITAERLDTWMRDSFAPKILQMYALKTAAPVEGMAQLAALLAGSDEKTTRAVTEFARAFGMAFQLIDDVNNFSDSPAWGKHRGEDLRAGKPTYLLVSALEMLEGGERDRLRDILCRKDLRENDASLDEGIALVIRSGARERVHRLACDLVVPTWKALSDLVAPSTSKAEFRFLWESLLGLTIPNETPPDS